MAVGLRGEEVLGAGRVPPNLGMEEGALVDRLVPPKPLSSTHTRAYTHAYTHTRIHTYTCTPTCTHAHTHRRRWSHRERLLRADFKLSSAA